MRVCSWVYNHEELIKVEKDRDGTTGRVFD